MSMNHFQISVIVARMEENDVHILDYCHRFFNVITDYDLYVSI